MPLFDIDEPTNRPPPLSIDEIVFLTEKLKIKKSRLSRPQRAATRRANELAHARTVKDAYMRYRDVKQQAMVRRDRLFSGDLASRLLAQPDLYERAKRWDVLLSKKVVATEQPDQMNFVEAAEHLAALVTDCDTSIINVLGAQVEPEAQAVPQEPVPQLSPEQQVGALAVLREALDDPEQLAGAPHRVTLAQREVDRIEEITRKTTDIDAQQARLTHRIDDLETRAADANMPATTRMRLLQDARMLRSHKEKLEDEKHQLVLYVAGFDNRLKQMQEAEASLTALEALSALPETDLAGGLAREDSAIPPEIRQDFSDRKATVSEADSNVLRALLAQKHAVLEAKIMVAAQTPQPATQNLFLGEDDVMEITDAQAQTLLSLTEKALALSASAPADAVALLDLVAAKLTEFTQLRRISIARVEQPVEALTRLLARHRELVVERDRIWGLGGDQDEALLAALRAAKELLTAEAPRQDLETAEEQLNTLAIDLSTARGALGTQRDFGPVHNQAMRASQVAKQSVLNAYQTEKIRETEIGGVDRSLLLQTLDGDEVVYHRIKTDRYGAPKLAKNVPANLAEALLDQALVLERLGESNAEGIADLVAAEQRKAEVLSTHLLQNLPALKAIADRLDHAEAALESPLLKEFRHAGYRDAKERLNTLKEDYIHKTNATKLQKAKSDAVAIQTECEFTELNAQESKDTLRSGIKTLDKVDKSLAGKEMNRAFDEAIALKGKLEALLNTSDENIAAILPQGGFENGRAVLRGIDDAIARLARAKESDASLFNGFLKRSWDLRAKLLSKNIPYKDDPAGEVDRLKSDVDAASQSENLPDLSVLKSILSGKSAASFGEGAMSALEAAQAKLSTQADEAEDSITARADAQAAQARTRDTLDTAKTNLEEVSDYTRTRWNWTKHYVHPRMDEYKALETEMTQAETAFADGKRNPEIAQSEFDSIYARAATFQDLQTKAAMNQSLDRWDPANANINISGLRATMARALSQLGAQVKAFGATMVPPAGDPDEESGKIVAGMLAKAESIAAKVGPFPDAGFEGKIDALRNDKPDNASKKIRELREEALAQLRAVEDRVGTHPAIQLYRSNPSDGLVAWSDFRSEMLDIEIAITRGLKG